MKLTDENIREIQSRAEKATPGPTLMRYEHGGGRSLLETLDPKGNPLRKLVADYYEEPDREFYHHARTDIPALCADLLEAREAIRRLLNPSYRTDLHGSMVLDLDKRAEDQKFASAAMRGDPK